MRLPCLPRCFSPVMPDECFSRAKICCLQWIAGDGNLVTWDVSQNLIFPDNVPEEEQYHVDDWLCYCQRSHKGAVGVYGWLGTGPPNQTVYSRYDDAGLLTLGVVECLRCTCASTARLSNNNVNLKHWAQDLVYWDGDNHSYPDYPGWPGFLFPRGETWEELVADATANGLYVAPAVNWACEGVGPAAKIRFWACWHIAYQATSGEFTGEAWSVLAPFATGVAGIDWFVGDPGTPITLTPMGDGWPGSIVYPQRCEYEPCGDPLDCFAPCISGSKDCDGTTPAHKPVIYITFDTNSASCCISGTFAMRWTGAKYEITDPPSCLVDGCVITIYASLSCYLVSGGDPEYGAGENTAILRIEVTDGSGCTTVSATYVVGLSCSGGILNNNSGTIFMDMVCNDSHETDLDWVLHG